MQLPMVFNSLAQAIISAKRVENFLMADEIEIKKKAYEHDEDDAESSTSAPATHDLNPGFYFWTSSSSAALKIPEGVKVQCPRGGLTLIVGPTGSGKTTAVLSLMGQLKMRKLHEEDGEALVCPTNMPSHPES